MSTRKVDGMATCCRRHYLEPQEKVVELLLGKGTDVNALYAASSGDHEKVVELLLGKGGDVNAQYGWYGYAL